MPPSGKPLAPQVAIVPHAVSYHGDTREDEYAWLRDDNWQAVMKDPDALAGDIRAHLEAENAYTAATMQSTQELQDALFEEMRGRIEEDDASVPVTIGKHGWATRYRKDGEHVLVCWGQPDTHVEDMQVALDGNIEAAGCDYFKLAAYTPSPDGSMLAWSYDDKGSEYFTIRVRLLADGKDTDTQLLDTTGAGRWSADNKFLFYVAVDENHRPDKVMRHRLGTAQSEDTCVYTEADAGFFVSLDDTRSGRFIIISAHDHQTSECWLIPAHAPETAPICVATRTPGIEYELDDDAARDRLVLVTNWAPDGQAEDFLVAQAPVPTSHADRSSWQVIRPHVPGCLVLDAVPFSGHMAYLLRENALPRILVETQVTGETEAIEFDEEAYDLALGAMGEYDTTRLRFTYASMTTPMKTTDYDMGTGTHILRKSQNVPSGHDSADYVTRRITATSHDGAEVPVSIVYHRDTPLDGSAPVLLYGYGAYGITIPAGFSVTRLSLVTRGFIYAIAHIRGGKARGHNWFMQGRGTKKTNSFEDFAAAARALIELGWTKPGNITIHGGSAGGLLVGATINLAPDLFRAAVAEVPFVDVLTTMLDDTLPLTPPEWPEWGNPIESATDYATIKAYAPYENIREIDYPHILATGGLTDPRVTYWEPAKWIARLRARRTDKGLSLLHTEMTAGHGGKAGRFNQLHEVAFVYAFVIFVHTVLREKEK
ncbi:MAG: S9 family peptidase [Parvibaculales bacterium]